MVEVIWEKPAPGSWELDASHQCHPYGRYVDEAMLQATADGAAEGFRRAGIPLRTVQGAIINGWWYIAVRPVAGPAEGGGPPPAFALWLMFKLHPELRRRSKAAARFFVEREWEKMKREWFENHRPVYVERMQALVARREEDLSDEDLASLITATTQLFREVTHTHFAGVPAVAIPTGDFLLHSEKWAGVEAKHSIRALSGYTAATTSPLLGLDRILDALRDADALSVLDEADAQNVLTKIAAASTVAATRLAEYQREFGPRLATDYSVFGKTLSEMPELLVDNLRQRTLAAAQSGQARERANAVAAEIRARVPPEHRAEWDDMLACARGCTDRREDEGGVLLTIIGLARLALLDAGHRFVSRGLCDEAESAFDLTESEVVAVLRGEGPSADQIRAHTAERKRNAVLTPPKIVGPVSAPPPVEVFPENMRRLVGATFAFVNRFSRDADPVEESGLAGHGVSAGTVTGRACVVRGPKDFDRFAQGDILVAPMTSPAFNTLLASASGVVTETGGLICHAAIVAREFGIPGIVGVTNVLQQIPDGALIKVDGDRGVVELLAERAPDKHTVRTRPAEADIPDATVPTEAGVIAPLADAGDATRFGGKAASLSQLERSDVRVPWGVALCVDAAQAIAAGDHDHIERLRVALADRSGPFAVRSSATVEDAVNASFAGQFKTVLGVGVDAVVDAIAEVWRSGHSASVRAYQRRLGHTDPVRMAVVIQELVPAKSAGVLFFDPKRATQIVEAAWGYGETVVDGSVTPDRYEMDVEGNLRDTTIGNKAVELVTNGSGLKRRAVDPARASTRCLTDAQLAALAVLGRQTHNAFGDGRDVEWAVAGDTLYCLQARPITRSVG